MAPQFLGQNAKLVGNTVFDFHLLGKHGTTRFDGSNLTAS